MRAMWLATVMVLLTLVFTTFPSLLYGHPAIESDTMKKKGTPYSFVGIRDGYKVQVPNEKSSGTVEVQVILPSEFVLLGIGETKGWTAFTLADAEGRDRIIVWNGSAIEAGGVEEFEFVALNPDLIEVFTFVVIQVYDDGSRDVWRPWMIIRFPLSLGGVDLYVLGYGAGALALTLPLFETLTRRLSPKNSERKTAD